MEEQLWANELAQLTYGDEGEAAAGDEQYVNGVEENGGLEDNDLLRFMYEDIIGNLDHCNISTTPPPYQVKITNTHRIFRTLCHFCL